MSKVNTELTEKAIWSRAELYVRNEVFLCLSGVVAKFREQADFEFYELLQGQPTYGTVTCLECDLSVDGEPPSDGLKCPSCKGELTFEPEEYEEVYEHWAVSQWLHDKLKAQTSTDCVYGAGLLRVRAYPWTA